MLLAIAFRHQQGQRLHDDLGLGVAENDFSAPIPAHNVAGAVTRDNRIVGRLRNGVMTCSAFLQSDLGPLAARNVHLDAAQPARLTVLGDDCDDIAQPNRTSILGDHPVLEIIRFLASCMVGAMGRHPVPILGMQVLHPETWIEPIADCIAKQTLHLPADKAECQRGCVGLPDNSVGGIDHVPKALLRGLECLLGLLAHGRFAQQDHKARRLTLLSAFGGNR